MAARRKSNPKTKVKGRPKAKTTKAATIDEYLEGVSPENRAALEEIRQAIKAAAPKAEEGFSYGLPAFRLGGRPLAAFVAAAKHCAFYPMSGKIVEAYQDELAGYDTSKGTVRFPASEPLPAALVRKLVQARIKELEKK